MANKIYKKRLNSNDSVLSAGESEEKCSSMNNYSIEDIISPSRESSVRNDLQSKRKKKRSNDNSIDHDISEISSSGECDMKKEKKKQRFLGKNEINILNCAVTNYSSPKKITGHENALNSDISDIISPSIESFLKNDSPSKKKKKLSNENGIDHDISDKSLSGECEMKTQKKKRRFLRNKELNILNCAVTNDSSSKIIKYANALDSDISEIISPSRESSVTNDSPSKKKSKCVTENGLDHEISESSSSGEREMKMKKKKPSFQGDEINILACALTNDSSSSKVTKHLNENAVDSGISEVSVRGQYEVKMKHREVSEYAEKFDSDCDLHTEGLDEAHEDLNNEKKLNYGSINSQDNERKQHKKKSGRKDRDTKSPKKIDYDRSCSIFSSKVDISQNLTDQENDQNFKEETEESTSKNRKKHKDKGVDITSDMEFDQICENVSSEETITKKRKHESQKKKSKKLRASENICVDENVSENSKNLVPDDNRNNFNRKETTSHFQENSSDFIASSQFDKDCHAKRSRSKKSKKKAIEECNRINQNATLALTSEFSDIPEGDMSKSKVKKAEKKKLSDFISSSLLSTLTSKLDEIVETEKKDSSCSISKGRSEDYKEIKGIEDESTYCSEPADRIETKKSTKVNSIPDSVLNNLLERIDDIVEKDRSTGVEAEDKKRKPHIKEKKKIIELLKETKSMERITDELNIMRDDDEIEKLKCLNITMPWPLPKIHQIACNISFCPDEEQRRALEAEGIKLKVGKYTKEEDEKIRQNWKSFCRYHDWDEENYQPFVKGSKRCKYGILDSIKYKKFVQFISHNFENRLMYNIYSRFQRLFTKKDISIENFTPEDDKIIIEYVDSGAGNKPYADLEVLLKRPRLAIIKRYKRLQTEKLFENRRINWNEHLVKKLIDQILKVTKSSGLSDLKDRHITTKEWDKIALKMEIPTDKLRRVWVLDFYTRLINPLYEQQYEETKHKLLEILSEEYTDWREIDWRYVAEKIGNSFSYNRLYRIFKDMTMSVPKIKRKDLTACLKHLKDMKFKKFPNKYAFVSKIFEEMKN